MDLSAVNRKLSKGPEREGRRSGKAGCAELEGRVLGCQAWGYKAQYLD